uniref:RNA helicase n=1 Tax=Heterosigma akashiwo TaxID=2829 RepID=A0A7S4DKM7_HETAK
MDRVMAFRALSRGSFPALTHALAYGAPLKCTPALICLRGLAGYQKTTAFSSRKAVSMAASKSERSAKFFRDWDDSSISRNRQRGSAVKKMENPAVLDRVLKNVQIDPMTYFYSQKEFQEIGASDEGIKALEAFGIKRPSKIQAMAHRVLSAGHTAIIADQTGSGKTLAYLLPLVERLRAEEVADPGCRARPGAPRMLVLAPTAELAAQVHLVAKGLSATCPLRSMCVTGSADFKQQVRLLKENPVDLLIATPGRVANLLEREVLTLEALRAAVLDEVDVLFLDESFDLGAVGAGAPRATQFVFVTATLPGEVADQVAGEFPDVKQVIGPGLHKVSPNLEQVIIDCSGPEGEKKTEETGFAHKRAALAQLMLTVRAHRTLVFCNTIENCRKVENALRRLDKRGDKHILLPYHNAIEPQKRGEHLRTFMRSNSLNPMVLICTDRASRGMDFEQAEVDHVVLFDFPRDAAEYVRRVGRTARAGRKGRVTALVFGRQLGLAREIIRLNRSGERLAELPSKSGSKDNQQDDDERMNGRRHAGRRSTGRQGSGRGGGSARGRGGRKPVRR